MSEIDRDSIITADPKIAESITLLMRRAMLDNGPEQEIALRLGINKGIKAGLDPHSIVVLDTRTNTTMRSMQKLVEYNRGLLTTARNKIAALEAENERLRAIITEKKGVPLREHLLAELAKIWISGKERGAGKKTLEELATKWAKETGDTRSANSLTQQFYNEGPPSAMKIVVKKSGLPSWPELWVLGHFLKLEQEDSKDASKRDRGWMKPLALALFGTDNFPFGKGRPAIKSGMFDSVKLDSLRERYIKANGETEGRKNEFHGRMRIVIQEAVRKAGITGILRSDLVKAGYDQRRISDLYRDRCIIEIEENPPRYVHAQFRDTYSEAYARQDQQLLEKAEKT